MFKCENENLRVDETYIIFGAFVICNFLEWRIAVREAEVILFIS